RGRMVLDKTRLGPIKNHGIGGFADARIPKGQMIWMFDARIDVRVPISDLPTLPPPMRAFLRKYGYEEMHEDRRTIVLCGHHARHVNHSKDANVTEGEADIAARDIERGGELTCNYYAFDLDAERKPSQGRSTRAARKSRSVLV